MDDEIPPPPPPLVRDNGFQGPSVILQGNRYNIRKNQNNSDMIHFQDGEYYLQQDPVTEQRFIIRNGNRINFTQGGSKRKRSKRKRTRKYKK